MRGRHYQYASDNAGKNPGPSPRAGLADVEEP